MKKNLPEFIAGLVVSAGSMIFGIYELAMNMGKRIDKQGQKALKELEKKMKEYAEEQGEPMKSIMNMVARLLSAGHDSLGLILAHLLGISVVIVILLLSYYVYSRHRVGRARVRARISTKQEDYK